MVSISIYSSSTVVVVTLVEHRSIAFTPIILSCMGCSSKLTDTYIKQLVSLHDIRENAESPYSMTTNWIQCGSGLPYMDGSYMSSGLQVNPLVVNPYIIQTFFWPQLRADYRGWLSDCLCYSSIITTVV